MYARVCACMYVCIRDIAFHAIKHWFSNASMKHTYLYMCIAEALYWIFCSRYSTHMHTHKRTKTHTHTHTHTGRSSKARTEAQGSSRVSVGISIHQILGEIIGSTELLGSLNTADAHNSNRGTLGLELGQVVAELLGVFPCSEIPEVCEHDHDGFAASCRRAPRWGDWRALAARYFNDWDRFQLVVLCSHADQRRTALVELPSCACYSLFLRGSDASESQRSHALQAWCCWQWPSGAYPYLGDKDQYGAMPKWAGGMHARRWPAQSAKKTLLRDSFDAWQAFILFERRRMRGIISHWEKVKVQKTLKNSCMHCTQSVHE